MKKTKIFYDKKKIRPENTPLTACKIREMEKKGVTIRDLKKKY